MLNVTVTQPESYGYLTVYPDGTAPPLASNLNFTPGETVPNLVVAPVGADGKVDFFNGSSGTVEVIADVSGYFAGGGSATNGAFTPLNPDRILDTRTGTGAQAEAVAPGGTVVLKADGVGGVPSSGVSAVVLNVTETQPEAAGYVTVYPDGAPQPLASNLNFSSGQTVPNLVVATVGADGDVDIFNGSSGSVQLIADLFGYFSGGATTGIGALTSLTPDRLLDTRTGTGAPAQPVAPGESLSLSVEGRGGVSGANVEAAVLNVTVTDPQAAGYIAVYPDGTPLPLVSNLNFQPGQTVANLFVGLIGADGKVDFYNGSSSTVELVADVSGSFAGLGAAALGGVDDVTSDDGTYCAVVTSGGVDCWGLGDYGDLGNGTVSTDTWTPVEVLAVGGVGDLTGVTKIVSPGTNAYCAITTSGGVDCWGLLANVGLGTETEIATTPVAIAGVGGVGTLSGVTALAGDTWGNLCAVLQTGGVDCWGNNQYGDLGNGTTKASTTPVQVVGVGGSGALSGVASLTVSSVLTFCALLTSGDVDCWGDNPTLLGNGSQTASDTPVQVTGVGGSGTLTGVGSLYSSNDAFCAVLTSGDVDCWGNGSNGTLGDGSDSNSGVPVQVVAVNGRGALADVSELTGNYSSWCALLTSGRVDCWGDGYEGQLGGGTDTASESPVKVVGVGGTGTLSGVVSLPDDFGDSPVYGSFCAVLSSGGVDCWGDNQSGQLGGGNHSFTTTPPVQVLGVGGYSLLSGVNGVVLGSINGFATPCALVVSGGLDCWGGSPGASDSYGPPTPVLAVG